MKTKLTQIDNHSHCSRAPAASRSRDCIHFAPHVRATFPRYDCLVRYLAWFALGKLRISPQRKRVSEQKLHSHEQATYPFTTPQQQRLIPITHLLSRDTTPARNKQRSSKKHWILEKKQTRFKAAPFEGHSPSRRSRPCHSSPTYRYATQHAVLRTGARASATDAWQSRA